MKKLLGLLSATWVIAACTEMPPEAYTNRGDPEYLLDVSSEVVTLGIGTPSSLGQLASIVADDPPARAELNCSSTDAMCIRARNILEQHSVPADVMGGGDTVVLIYDRIMARDCQNRYIDNAINPYNLNHPTFGCSIMANMVQQVSDKRQFVNPSLMDFQDGEKAVQTYEKYLEPSVSSDMGGDSGSMTSGSSGSSLINKISR